MMHQKETRQDWGCGVGRACGGERRDPLNKGWAGRTGRRTGGGGQIASPSIATRVWQWQSRSHHKVGGEGREERERRSREGDFSLSLDAQMIVGRKKRSEGRGKGKGSMGHKRGGWLQKKKEE